ncbi:pectate lyase [Nordella sp. HKS 07]|uniref:pectate lyase n=1 Tax=Nordella sp. HKS 07 TaxID=2712222 RepID=UPI001FEE763A|nr:pectate lyase [Nordella sp. HKS 07]
MNIRVLLLTLPVLITAVTEVNLSAQAEPVKALSPQLPDGSQRAFPTAEGFGAAAKGGRGGAVIYVTNTDEAGPGSLRECIEATGPRTCIFRVGGTIQLDKGSLVIRNPFITIAGETAPGGGIAIRNGSTQIRPSIEIKTNDVIIRHLRLRPGPHTVKACCSGALGMYTPAARNIMLDHISASWGSDETIDSEDASNFTFQWGLVGEPLLNGGPGKKNRARNMLFTKGGNLTIHHTLFTTGKFRNPQVKMKLPDSVADVVNNVMYSPEWQYVVSFGDEWVHMRANVVGNYKLAGVNEKNDHLVAVFEESGLGFSIFLQGNFDGSYRPDAAGPEDLVMAPEQRKYIVTTRNPAPEVRTTSPQQAYDDVLANAGATRPVRDAVDARLIEDVKNRRGKLLKSDPEKVGGWPQLESGTPYADSDKDGISDQWEEAHGLNPNDGSDAQLDRNGDGWTNLEEFLHNLAGDPQ